MLAIIIRHGSTCMNLIFATAKKQSELTVLTMRKIQSIYYKYYMVELWIFGYRLTSILAESLSMLAGYQEATSWFSISHFLI